VTKRKLPTVLVAVAGIIIGVAVAGGSAVAAHAQTSTTAASTADLHRTAAPGGTWSKAIPVPGMGDINDFTCTSPGNCVAVGQGSSNGDASFATERNGVWHPAQYFYGLLTSGRSSTSVVIGQVQAVACSSPGDCVAGGGFRPGAGGGYPKPWAVVEKDGTWGHARPISGAPGGAINAISCARNGDCTAVGYEAPGPNDTQMAGLAVTESGGSWGTAHLIPEPSATSWAYFTLDLVSCAANGDCSAGASVVNGANGGYGESMAGLVDETNGVWGTATLVPGLPSGNSTGVVNNAIAAISCQAPGDCTAVGRYDVEAINASKPSVSGSFLLTEADGGWQPTDLMPPSDSENYDGSLSCTSFGNCAIAGSDGNNGDVFTADEVNGHVVGQPAVLPGVAALNVGKSFYGWSGPVVSSAPTGYCALGGTYAGRGTDNIQALVAVKTGAGWQRAQQVRGIPQSTGGPSQPSIVAISCLATGYCSAAGNYYSFRTSSDETQAFVIDEATPSAAALHLSRGSIIYGHETAERLTVDVTSHYANALTGTVTIKAGSTTLAVLTLKSGQASYTLRAKQLKTADYALTVTYSGDTAYLASSSAAVKLKVVK
jgi:hypothetical protein